ncbi:hypothetical protein [Nannocystis punicea]|uniref:Myxococcus cysteine-rich repeat-containing protein n=1 Tax=Nannocystis punicea TaxID=2995304 RepID=A0ABY7HJ45_9BACT|nr:hypothetical protein [Nannocystis poenicansa]WAS99329.1 hypothetical protein O0S08_24640 [Nannocystis poenicansa]
MTTCPQHCTEPTCGNGVKEESEPCDDGNKVDGDACTNACTTGGDGILWPGEEELPPLLHRRPLKNSARPTPRLRLPKAAGEGSAFRCATCERLDPRRPRATHRLATAHPSPAASPSASRATNACSSCASISSATSFITV